MTVVIVKKGHCPWREKTFLERMKRENNADSNSSKLMILQVNINVLVLSRPDHRNCHGLVFRPM